ncbi:MAG: hypothetical protein GF419_00645 [Ignavibacteriales bacterium]|nr:hypothetical protein [Ignavibacteriales bacterium]
MKAKLIPIVFTTLLFHTACDYFSGGGEIVDPDPVGEYTYVAYTLEGDVAVEGSMDLEFTEGDSLAYIMIYPPPPMPDYMIVGEYRINAAGEDGAPDARAGHPVGAGPVTGMIFADSAHFDLGFTTEGPPNPGDHIALDAEFDGEDFVGEWRRLGLEGPELGGSFELRKN